MRITHRNAAHARFPAARVAVLRVSGSIAFADVQFVAANGSGQDSFDLDLDGDVTEHVPLDFDGNARFVDIPSIPDTGNGTAPLVDFGPWKRP